MLTLQQAIERVGLDELNGNQNRTLTLFDVHWFAFGKTYKIVMYRNGSALTGGSPIELECEDLEEILDIMHTEFSKYDVRVPILTIPREFIHNGMKTARRFAGAMTQNSLLVEPVDVRANNADMALPLDEVIDEVRQAVTLFNLSGTWLRPATGNL